MNTKKLMDIALELSGLDTAPHDSGILVEGENLKKVLIGIDMATPELLLGKELGVDCVISHHPHAGRPSVDFAKVMDIQIDKMMEFGVPINKAQKVLRKKVRSVDMGSHVSNYDRASSAAKILGIPYMNIHLPADIITENYVQSYLDNKFEGNERKTVGEVLNALKEMDEYKDALAGPVIRVGSEGDFAGKIAVLMAGGTNGGADVYKAYFEAGVGTIVCMHVPEDVKKAVEEQNIGNVIVAGHMASDSIGLNIIIDKWKEEGLEVIKMSGIY